MLSFLVDEQLEAIHGPGHLELDLSLPNYKETKKIGSHEPNKVKKRLKRKDKILNSSSSRMGR
jgi:hypothetical protein